MSAAVSPDGRWIAYTSDSSGRIEVYVQSFPQGGQRLQLSTNEAARPIWSPDGRRLYFVGYEEDTSHLLVVPIWTDQEIRGGLPERLFDLPRSPGYFSNLPFFDISPDGMSFVMVRAAEPAEPEREIRVIQNWFQELERLAPTSRN